MKRGDSERVFKIFKKVSKSQVLLSGLVFETNYTIQSKETTELVERNLSHLKSKVQ